MIATSTGSTDSMVTGSCPSGSIVTLAKPETIVYEVEPIVPIEGTNCQ